MLLSATDLRRTVADRVVWSGVELTVNPGDRVAVTGPSGSGKTLLLRTLAGLDPLETGEITLAGRPQAQWAMPAYRSQVMYLPQRPFVGTGTVLDELKRPFQFKVHAARRFEQDAAARWLTALHRPDLLQLNASTLSGGEGQVLALVRALLLNPALLLLDEATASLDPETTHAAEALLAQWLIDGPERAVIWVTHDPVQRARVATRLLPVVPG
ncbi:putative ABC transport system ATP-binding protein [Deinococcus metalli]|uniref:ABC transporter ATP-binding protein n=1 Tax=Deinococcus metalli TaxID=1141878 RepID=A0A7W8NU53_9DEIO|nr:ATP-binding cassette domain-containing protein [Deinococcus metalli]MBB5378967.1 putative ABC transport system ATP-binding protein [Deinococcus metalli]GHF63701.1 ABC transporter ATP-binding protein [Deinococcus metalli]